MRSVVLWLAFAVTTTLAPDLGAVPRQTRTRTAILAARTYAWLAQNQYGPHFGQDVAWLYDLLVRRFSFPELPALQRMRRDIRDGRFWKSSYAPLLHVLAPEVRYPAAERWDKLGDIDRIVFGTIWCHQAPLPKDYFDQLETLSQKGGYELTHMYLALIIAHEKHCSPYSTDAGRWQKLRDQLAEQMAAICNKSAIISDLQIESAAFLSYGGDGLRISHSFQRRLLDEAEMHLENPYVSMLSGHTAVLLLWYLTEQLEIPARRVELAPGP